MVLFGMQWLLAHPKFSSNPFYLGGDSYSGLIIPIVAEEIAKSNDIYKFKTHRDISKSRAYSISMKQITKLGIMLQVLKPEAYPKLISRYLFYLLCTNFFYWDRKILVT